MPDRRIRGIILGGNKFHILISEFEIVERFLDQVGVFVADMTKLGRRYAYEQDSIAGVAVARGFEPRIVRVAVDFLFQGVKNAHPRIRDDGGTGERHFLPEY